MDQMERIIAVLEERLPPEVLTAEDVMLMENRLMGAIIEKMAEKNAMTFDGYEHPALMN